MGVSKRRARAILAAARFRAIVAGPNITPAFQPAMPMRPARPDAQPPSRGADRACTEAVIAGVLEERLKRQGVGLAAVRVDGARVVSVTRGRLGADALLEVGSITKTFTALLLADAVLRGELALTDAVEDALAPSTLRDSAGEPIRWIDLATHRSGLPRLPVNLAPKDPADPYADHGAAQLEAGLRAFRPVRRRDQHWEYSNLGYGLLGQALARAAQTSYADLLAARILRPLGLHDVQLATPATALPRRAQGHDAQGRPVPPWHFDALAPAGALLMPAATLARYAQAAIGAFDHPLREAFALALSVHGDGPTPHNPIGLAWIRAPLNGRTVHNHDGGTSGFAASMWLDAERQCAAAVVANAAVDVNDLALHLLDGSVPLRSVCRPGS